MSLLKFNTIFVLDLLKKNHNLEGTNLAYFIRNIKLSYFAPTFDVELNYVCNKYRFYELKIRLFYKKLPELHINDPQ